jgi:hypothetical protein
MKPKSTTPFLATAVVALTIGPAGVYAAETAADETAVYDNSVEAGVGYSTTDSAKFGEWTGIDQQAAEMGQ